MRFIFFLIVFLVLWFVLACLSLIYRKNHTVKLFKAMEKLLKLQYGVLLKILDIVKKNIQEDNSIIEETINYIDLTEKIPSDELNIDRKLGINALINKNFQYIMKRAEIYPNIQSSNDFISSVQKLKEFEGCLVSSAEKYNCSVYKLKHMVEVFPTSFMARLINIKAIDAL